MLPSESSQSAIADTRLDWIRRPMDSHPKLVRRLLLAAVLVFVTLYAAHGLKRGWVPADEGFLGQSAERVLHGELPHRDYSEGYTGGLTYLNAAAFRLFGTNLASMRYMLFLFFVIWVPAFHYAARRFVSAPVAGAVTVLAAAWSIPNYPAALPSWYNLFFATFGLAAVLRFLETERRGWLFVAGLCGGISFLFKLSGLYFVAGVLLFLFFRELTTPRKKTMGGSDTMFYRIFLVAAVVSYEALVLGLLLRAANAATIVYFGAPDLAIGAAILWLEFSSPEKGYRRLSFLFRDLILLAAGALTPLAIFWGHYVQAGSQSSLREVFTLAARQLDYGAFKPSLLKIVGGSLITLILIVAAFLARGRAARVLAAVFLLGIPVALLLARIQPYVDRAEWGAIWTLLPVVVVLGVFLLVSHRPGNRANRAQQQRIFLVLSVTAACSLIQYPFTIAIYFCYVAPLAFLSAAAVGSLRKPPRWAVVGALCFAFFYVVLDATPGFIDDMGEQYSPDRQVSRLTIPRAGGLRVYPESAGLYEELGVLVQQHARGEYIYATPDCPEVYFLNGFRNPTPTLFDFYEDPAGRTQRILQSIRQHGVNLVVLNGRPQFSVPLPSDLRAALELEFPNRARTGKFEVRWKP